MTDGVIDQMIVTHSAASPSPTPEALIAAVEQADSPERLLAAVQRLAASPSEVSIPTLIRVLGYNNAGAASLAMQGLVQLGAAAVAPLLDQLDDYNYGARAWAIRALVAIRDPRALEVLLSAAAADFAPSVRRAATKGLGTLLWQQLPDHQRWQAQARTLETLLTIAQDSDWSLRYAAIVGLQGLALALAPSRECNRIQQQLQQMTTDTDRAVLARARYALTVVGAAPETA